MNNDINHLPPYFEGDYRDVLGPPNFIEGDEFDPSIPHKPNELVDATTDY